MPHLNPLLNYCSIVGRKKALLKVEVEVKSRTRTAKKRRVRRAPEAARTLILDTTEKLMLEEGYAAASTRRVAGDAGLAPALVHYYYPTTDDLLIALHRRMTERQIEKLRVVLAADNPLRALWEFQTTWTHTSLGMEFMALANHRKSICREIARRTEHARDMQAGVLQSFLARSSLLPGACTPLSLATLVMAVARALVNEEAIGITRGHDDVRELVAWAIDRLATGHPPPGKSVPAKRRAQPRRASARRTSSGKA